MKLAKAGGADPMVTEEQVATMFSNVTEILEIHRNLLEQLKDAMQRWHPLYNMGVIYIALVHPPPFFFLPLLGSSFV